MAKPLFVDSEYEKKMVAEYKLMPNDNRELHVLGTYTPVPGIFSLGWTGWKDHPAADFVSGLISWHDGFSRDHASDPFYPIFGPLIEKGELTKPELKSFFTYLMAVTSQNFVFEGVSQVRAHLLGVREVRDIIARHLFEEVGHNEMLAEFMAGYFKMDRVKEVDPLADFNTFNKDQYEMYMRFRALNEKGHFVELAAASMLMERFIPRPHRQMAVGLRKHYHVPNNLMTFFDIHSYIDIYHERFGTYILSKYATTKELQDMARQAFEKAIIARYTSWKKQYESMPISRR